jgi:NTP pyrophosphatase (non-canonical NTP hydrolase)
MTEQKLSQHTYRQASLEHYQAEIAQIWPQLALRPALHTWARVVQHATTACEGMRRDNWAIVIKEIGKVNVWWLAFIQKLNLLSTPNADGDYDDDVVFGLPLSPTELIWRKYPYVCPVEFGLASPDLAIPWENRPAQECSCLGRKKLVEERSQEEKRHAKHLLEEFARAQRHQCPNSIEGLERMLRLIFSGPVHTLSFHELSFHFIEEIGEVSEALAEATTSEALSETPVNSAKLIAERSHKLRAIAEELADVWSWSVSILAKVQEHLISFEKYLESRHDGSQLEAIRNLLKGSQHLNVPEVIWQEYGLPYGELRCHDCDHRPCTCTQQRAQPLYKQAFHRMSEDRQHAFIEAVHGLTW